MKKINKYLLLFLILLCFITGCGSTSNNSNNSNTSEVVSIQESISGVVKDVTMNSLTIDYNGNEYTFGLIDYKENNEMDTLFDGDSVTISFSGTCYSNKNYQDGATITGIKIDKYVDIDLSAYDTSGVFKDYYVVAYRKLLSMTTSEKIGQVLFARVPESKQVEAVMKYNLGGYIMFGRDFDGKTRDEVVNTIASYQNAAFIPLIIAVDEEGGYVVRVSSNPNLASSKFKFSQEVYKEGGFAAIKDDTINKSKVLSELGINMNLAPVSDVSTDPNDYIYDRSFGKDANETSTFVKTVIEASKGGGVTYTLKHFPGYGNNVDTHTGIATDNRSLEDFKTNDFLPFEAGIDSGAVSILVNHNIIMAVDSKVPASLSPAIHKILRNDLSFTGIIMTDDLAMEAIKDYTTTSPAVDALNAGNDLLIVTDYVGAYNEITSAVNNGVVTEETLDNAVLKVLAYKYYVNLLRKI